jgi:hypothetical protein
MERTSSMPGFTLVGRVSSELVSTFFFFFSPCVATNFYLKLINEVSFSSEALGALANVCSGVVTDDRWPRPKVDARLPG